jgi:hypothetical protein
VPHHERQLAGVRRNLELNVGVIAMQRLSGRRGVVGIEIAWVLDDGPTDHEARLLCDHKTMPVVVLIVSRQEHVRTHKTGAPRGTPAHQSSARLKAHS